MPNASKLTGKLLAFTKFYCQVLASFIRSTIINVGETSARTVMTASVTQKTGWTVSVFKTWIKNYLLQLYVWFWTSCKMLKTKSLPIKYAILWKWIESFEKQKCEFQVIKKLPLSKKNLLKFAGDLNVSLCRKVLHKYMFS